MDNVSKMRSQLKAGLKQRDTLIPTKVDISAAPKPEKAPDQRKLPEEKLPVLYPVRLQIPISHEQSILLTKIAQSVRAGGGEPINKGAVVRCLINLLKDVQLSGGDSVTTEEQLENLLRAKMRG